VLEQRFRALRDGGYNVIALGDAVNGLAAGNLPPRSVVLTFDDGFADFALKVHPLLARFGFPATVYLTTYYSQFNYPVFGVFCSYVLWKSSATRVCSTDLVPALQSKTWNLRDPLDRQAAHRAIVDYADHNALSGADKDSLARHIARTVGVDYEDLLRRRILSLLRPEEVTALSGQSVDFQLHTHRHRTPRDRTLFLREIEDNRAALSGMTGRNPEHFCYPSGVYESEFLTWLRESGVRSATTCDTGIADPATDPLLMPRLIDTMNIAPIEFDSWLSGVGAFLPLRPHRVAYSR